MKIAAEIEMNFSEFWETTPYEFSLHVEAYSKRKKEDNEEQVTLAYVNALWTIQWMGKKENHPKPLNEILGIKEEKKVMTDQQMLAKARQLNAIFGGSEVENG